MQLQTFWRQNWSNFLAQNLIWWRSKKQNGLRAEWVQEQKNRKIITYIDFIWAN